MQTDGQTTVETISPNIPDLVVIPRLFNEPVEGWVNWAVESAGETEPINPDTISGRLVAATGPAWFYGKLLPHILSGRYETVLRQATGEKSKTAKIEDGLELTGGISRKWLAIARKARREFEAGRPLYIAPWEGIERYRRVPVTLRMMGDGQYQAGENGQSVVFQAESAPMALDKARQIYMEARRKEIEAAREAVLSSTKAAPPLVLDLLTALLQRDKALIDTDGLPLVWENGAHGMYAVQGPDWCYMLNCSAPVAARFAALSQRQAIKEGQRVSIQVDVKGEVAELLGLVDWQETVAGFEWQGGDWQTLGDQTNRGVVRLNNRPKFVAEAKPTGGERYNWVGRLYDAKKDVVIESPVPVDWELTRGDVLAWVIWQGIKREARQ